MAGEAAFLRKLQAVMPRVTKQVNTGYRKLVTNVFTDLVTNSPQWSGKLASNWTFGTTMPNRATLAFEGDHSWYTTNPKKMGDSGAKDEALGRELPTLDAITYLKPTIIRNLTPYVSEVEDNEGPLGKDIREENIHKSYGAVAMIGYVNMKYSTLKRR